MKNLLEKNSLLKQITNSHEASLIMLFILLCAVVEIFSPSFLSPDNIVQILRNNAATLIMTLGMLCVLVVGGIDISITSTLAFSGMTMGIMLKKGIAVNTLQAVIVALLIGTLCGFIIGIIIAKGKVPPIIATLGTMYVYRACAYLVSNSSWAGADALPDDLKKFGTSNWIFVIVFLFYIVFFCMLKWTKFGRNIYAVGSNADAAKISGINVEHVKISVYTIMGFLCGVSGVLVTAIYASAMPNMQESKEMDVIAACVIGGVSMSGGSGSVVGALMGALILSVIAKALPLIGIDSIAQNTVKGVLILVVVVLNVITQRIMDKKSLERREI